MTNEERDIITQFVARVGGATQPSGFASGSVPATQPALPPIDREADSFIAQAFTKSPEARYRITQLAFVQEHALVEAQNRIQRLEWELQQAQQTAQQAQQNAQQAQQSETRPGGGFFSGLFGGGNRSQAAPQQGNPRWGGSGGGPGGYPGNQPQQPNYQQSAPPPPQYPPNYQQSMFQQRGGSGFLGSALTTAAGVAGGLVAGNALMSLFSPHQSGFGGGFGSAGAASPWATPGTAADTGSWGQGGAAAGNQDYVDNGTWDQPATGGDSSWADNSGTTDASWTDNSGGGDSGWDSGGGGNSDDTF
jgi:uncharacterized protein